jgi:uncharacterized protein DUF6502
VAPPKSGTPASRGDEDLAVRLFTRVASVLLRLGIDAPLAARIVREAFVLAAAESARAFARRATQSRIASIAGLSRLEVRKILSMRDSKNTREPKPRATRIEHLLQGWRSDARFLDRRGKPRALSFKGASSDFGLLVKRYGKDVTARALLEQMLRLQMVSKREGKVYLESRRRHSTTQLPAALNDLRFLVARLEDFNWLEGRRTFSVARAAITVSEKKTAQLVRRIALERIETVLGSIGALNIEFGTNKGRVQRKNRLLVTASIVADVEE